jgi:nicotinate (nicotinamide) nucleotide adenylyltransferase
MNPEVRGPSFRWLRRNRVSTNAGATVRLGVLSGTFNPPTEAHLALAEAGQRQLGLEEVLFVLPEIPPHKGDLAAPLQSRAEMLWLAVQGHRGFSAAMVTHGLFLDIQRALEAEYPPGTRAVFLAGRDAAERILLHWPYEDPQSALAEMFARFDFAVAERPSSRGLPGRFEIPDSAPAWRFRNQVLAVGLPEELAGLSSTEVRERLARGASVAGMVPEAVLSYIQSRGLYAKQPLH